MVDFVTGAFDTSIRVGDIVAYPGRRSSSLWLNRGEVVEILTFPPNYWNKEETYRLRIRREARNKWETHNKLVTVWNLHNVIPLT